MFSRVFLTSAGSKKTTAEESVYFYCGSRSFQQGKSASFIGCIRPSTSYPQSLDGAGWSSQSRWHVCVPNLSCTVRNIPTALLHRFAVPAPSHFSQKCSPNQPSVLVIGLDEHPARIFQPASCFSFVVAIVFGSNRTVSSSNSSPSLSSHFLAPQ